MSNVASVGGYQPSVAYQGDRVNTPEQAPRESQTQPKQAPAADSQRGDQRASGEDASPDRRGGRVDVRA